MIIKESSVSLKEAGIINRYFSYIYINTINFNAEKLANNILLEAYDDADNLIRLH